MQTPASIGKHPIHPMLVALPIGLWVFSFICDIIYLATNQAQPAWSQVAYYTLAGGIVGALLAAVPGLIDLLSLRERTTRRVAIRHMITNVSALLIFAASLWMRTRDLSASTTPLILSAIGIAVVSYGGWLGGEMVYVGHVAVQEKPAAAPTREAGPPYFAGEQPERRPTRPQ